MHDDDDNEDDVGIHFQIYLNVFIVSEHHKMLGYF